MDTNTNFLKVCIGVFSSHIMYVNMTVNRPMQTDRACMVPNFSTDRDVAIHILWRGRNLWVGRRTNLGDSYLRYYAHSKMINWC